MTETQLSQAIQQALKLAGFYVIRIQAGSGRGAGGRMRLAPKGTPDLFVDPLGWLEVKTETGRLSEAQEAWHTAARARGSKVAVVRGVAEALAIVKGWANVGH